MYQRKGLRGSIKEDFYNGINVFVEFALSNNGNDPEIRCPCSRCRHLKFLLPDIVKVHLCQHGFTPEYYVWDRHGEVVANTSVESESVVNEIVSTTRIENMVEDAARSMFPMVEVDDDDVNVEEPNIEAKKIYDLLDAAKKPIWDGCKSGTQLSVIAEYIAMKSKYNITEAGFTAVVQAAKRHMPPDNLMCENHYEVKKLMSAFGLPYQKIDTCLKGCMLFWKEDANLRNCKVCNQERYKPRKKKGKEVPYKRMHYLPITPRLQRLYASSVTASNMRWHSVRTEEEGTLTHPADGEAWKHFDKTYPNFAAESRNVRLGLCTDGFSPFSQFGSKYSSWPIIVTPYNLPPWMCMKTQYMFLTVVVPGPDDPTQGIDVYLQPLIEELKILWNEGVETYDVSKKKNFRMFASLLWTISDFPAYAMLSGWSTAGRLACPYCMDETRAFSLPHGKKISWFDCHRYFLHVNHPFRGDKKNFLANRVETRQPPTIWSSEDIYELVKDYPKIYETGEQTEIEGKSVVHNWCKQTIFWELPYWKHLLLRHNIDVMHNEKNVFDNVFNTILNVKGKTKDDLKSRRDIEELCKRPELHMKPNDSKKPKACYELDNNQVKAVLKWVEGLRFPDGISSNLRRCVDFKNGRLSGMKSHDCHIMMENLFPVMFKELLPLKVWKVVTELSMFYKELCSTTLKVQRLRKLEVDIPILLCKLEKIFPPGFFNVMEHLPVHLPSEARLRGPVQYGWMYPFERYVICYHVI